MLERIGLGPLDARGVRMDSAVGKVSLPPATRTVTVPTLSVEQAKKNVAWWEGEIRAGRVRPTPDLLAMLADFKRVTVAVLLLLLLVAPASAQVTPGANFPLNGCVEGSPVMWVNGGLQCVGVASPTVSSCGVTPSVYGTDFAGVIGVGTGAVTTCLLTFGGSYAQPLRCVIASSLASIGLGQSTTASAMTIAMSLSLGGGGITYSCRP